MKKRLLSTLLALCLALGMLPAQGWAEEMDGSELVPSVGVEAVEPAESGLPEGESVDEAEENAPGISAEADTAERLTEGTSAQLNEWATSGNCGDKGNNVRWNLDVSSKTLTISGSGRMEDYDPRIAGDHPWNYNGSMLQYVVISSGVTHIGDCAFSGLDITRVTIAGSVTSIGENAFGSCNSLTAITIPNSVTSMGEGAFEFSGLKSITIPGSVASIGANTFSNCQSLESVAISDGVAEIGMMTFAGCTNLRSVILPDSVTSIDHTTFASCSSLKSITLPNRLTSIESNMFYNCSSLTSVTIPNSVTGIESSAFEGCSSLMSVTIPDSVTSLGDYAFSGCYSLKNVTIPDSVTSIERGTFSGCSSLTSVTIPKSATSIEGEAFYNCSSLTSVTIPKSITSIGYESFHNCNCLTDIYYIGSRADWQKIGISYGNEALTNAVIHANTPIYPFPYSENTPSESLAIDCARYSLLAYEDTTTNKNRQYVQNTMNTLEKLFNEEAREKEIRAAGAKLFGSTLRTDGFEDLYSYNYGGVGTSVGGIVSRKYEKGEHSICYTIGHRDVQMPDGSVQSQVIIVFRGTSGDEWYGNFDITANKYIAGTNTHYSFQLAVNDAAESLYKYIKEMKAKGKIDSSGLSILMTGHSRGAAVANILAHELTDVRDGKASNYGEDTNISKLTQYKINSVYAYTYATPSVASNNTISAYGKYDNIFNYCFTDDFVPNLPLEAWSWGKYGRTYWATAARLAESNGHFRMQTKNYFGKSAHYNTHYTNEIVETAVAMTRGGVKDYYDAEYRFDWPSTMNLHDYMRNGVGAAMAKGGLINSGKGLLVVGVSGNIYPFAFNRYFRTLSNNFVKGSTINPALDNTHQCGSYYVGVKTSFRSFVGATASFSSSRSATLYSVQGGYDAGTANTEEVAAIRAFLQQSTTIEEKTYTNAEMLSWTTDAPSTWDGICWDENGHITSIDMSGYGVFGRLDLSGFAYLEDLNVSYNTLTELVLKGCSSLQILECSCNLLTTLDVGACPRLQSLSCGHNAIRSLDLETCHELIYLACDYNYLDPLAIAATAQTINSRTDGLAEYLPQNIIPEIEFASNDKMKLLDIANTASNNEKLNWDLDNPATWGGVEWSLVNGTYYLSSVDLQNLGLAGYADFSGCTYLQNLLITGNDFGTLDVTGCNLLETLWCAYNYLDARQLQSIAEADGELNAVVAPQKLPDGAQLAEVDVAALTALINSQNLDWGTNALANNPALTWTKDEDGGVYMLTQIDLTDVPVSGTVDLSGFSSLISVSAVGAGMERIVLPGHMTEIGKNAFVGCDKLCSVNLPKNLIRVGSQAFLGCTSLETVEFPATLTSVGEKAFYGCSSLSVVTFDGGVPFIGENAFIQCGEDLQLRLSFDVSEIELEENETYPLSTEKFASETVLAWTSSQPSIAAVSDQGVITAVNAGKAIITASFASGFSAVCSVTVKGQYIIEMLDHSETSVLVSVTNSSDFSAPDAHYIVAVYDPAGHMIACSMLSRQLDAQENLSLIVDFPLKSGASEVRAFVLARDSLIPLRNDWRKTLS